MVVVADTSPINYLILINRIEVLSRLYRQIVIPEEVATELFDHDAPAAVRVWMEQHRDGLKSGARRFPTLA
jgi:predicted nucleic acid-binding protein